MERDLRCVPISMDMAARSRTGSYVFSRGVKSWAICPLWFLCIFNAFQYSLLAL